MKELVVQPDLYAASPQPVKQLSPIGFPQLIDVIGERYLDDPVPCQAFDVVDDGRDKLVYMSAVRPGSKLQFSYQRGGASAYPVDGKVDREVRKNVEYSLQLAIRDRLVNVAIDGKLRGCGMVQLRLWGMLESTVRYLGIEVDDSLGIAEHTEV